MNRVSGEDIEYAGPASRVAYDDSFFLGVLKPVVLDSVEVRPRPEPEPDLIFPVVVHGVCSSGGMLQASPGLGNHSVSAELILQNKKVVIIVAIKLVLRVIDKVAPADSIRRLWTLI